MAFTQVTSYCCWTFWRQSGSKIKQSTWVLAGSRLYFRTVGNGWCRRQWLLHWPAGVTVQCHWNRHSAHWFTHSQASKRFTQRINNKVNWCVTSDRSRASHPLIGYVLSNITGKWWQLSLSNFQACHYIPRWQHVAMGHGDVCCASQHVCRRKWPRLCYQNTDGMVWHNRV